MNYSLSLVFRVYSLLRPAPTPVGRLRVRLRVGQGIEGPGDADAGNISAAHAIRHQAPLLSCIETTCHGGYKVRSWLATLCEMCGVLAFGSEVPRTRRTRRNAEVSKSRSYSRSKCRKPDTHTQGTRGRCVRGVDNSLTSALRSRQDRALSTETTVRLSRHPHSSRRTP